MTIALVGLSHKTAPIEVRERLAFNSDRLREALSSLVDHEAIDEGIILSTCNRVELITASSQPTDQIVRRVNGFLSEYHRLPLDKISPYLYTHAHQLAVRHVFRVASSLDSMVIGEAQILGQLKDAYSRALELGAVGRTLNNLMQKTFAVAKRVRTETGIGASAVSVSHAAVELAQKIFEDLDGKKVLLVGAGEMAELALKYFQASGAPDLTVTSRTVERAQSLANTIGARAIPLESLDDELTQTDVVLISVSAQAPIVTSARVAAAMERRKGRVLLLVDISVPRMLDPQASELENVFAFDIDDLQAVVEANQREREREAAAADSIIEKEVSVFFLKLRSAGQGATIKEFREEMARMAELEFTKRRSKLGALSPQQEEIVQDMIRSITNKLIHPVLAKLHDHSAQDRHTLQCLIEDVQENHRK